MDGQIIVVEGANNLGSTTLTQWRPLYTNAVNGGSLYFFDTHWENPLRQFYRVRLWP